MNNPPKFKVREVTDVKFIDLATGEVVLHLDTAIMTTDRSDKMATKKEIAEKLREARSNLLREIHNALPHFHATKVSNIETNRIFIEGGTFPAIFDRDTKQLSIWGRGSRHSGGQMTVEELVKLENALRLWDAEAVIDIG